MWLGSLEVKETLAKKWAEPFQIASFEDTTKADVIDVLQVPSELVT